MVTTATDFIPVAAAAVAAKHHAQLKTQTLDLRSSRTWHEGISF